MLRMQVSLGAVRARELPVGILLGNLVLSLDRSGGGCGRPSGCARQDAAATLRADNMCRRVTLREHRSLWHQWALAVRRVHAGLWHDASGGHGAEDGRGPATGSSRGGCDRLGMRCSGGGLRHHTR